MKNLDNYLKNFEFVYQLNDSIEKIHNGIHSILFLIDNDILDTSEFEIEDMNIDLLFGILKSDWSTKIITKTEDSILCRYNGTFYLLRVNDETLTINKVKYDRGIFTRF